MVQKWSNESILPAIDNSTELLPVPSLMRKKRNYIYISKAKARERLDGGVRTRRLLKRTTKQKMDTRHCGLDGTWHKRGGTAGSRQGHIEALYSSSCHDPLTIDGTWPDLSKKMKMERSHINAKSGLLNIFSFRFAFSQVSTSQFLPSEMWPHTSSFVYDGNIKTVLLVFIALVKFTIHSST